MKSVRQLKDILGLNTVHQTRNRIKAVKSVIEPYMKRGENNEILIGDEGITILTKLQDLYESGLLLSEAAEVIRSDYLPDEDNNTNTDSYSSVKYHSKPRQEVDLVDYLIDELEFQRELILNLTGSESKGNMEKNDNDAIEDKWWMEWI